MNPDDLGPDDRSRPLSTDDKILKQLELLNANIRSLGTYFWPVWLLLGFILWRLLVTPS